VHAASRCPMRNRVQAIVDLLTANGYEFKGNVAGPYRDRNFRRNNWFVRKEFVPSEQPGLPPVEYAAW
jgi:hypothetical protein